MARKKKVNPKEEILVSVAELAQAVLAHAERDLGSWGAIAAEACISRGTVYYIATGRTRDPRTSTLLGLCRAAGLRLKTTNNGRVLIEV